MLPLFALWQLIFNVGFRGILLAAAFPNNDDLSLMVKLTLAGSRLHRLDLN